MQYNKLGKIPGVRRLLGAYRNLKNPDELVGRSDRGRATPADAVAKFSYLLDRIEGAEILSEPFEHVEIKNFLRPEHLDVILNDDQVHFPPVPDVAALLSELEKRDYEIKRFPGCTEDINEYLEMLEGAAGSAALKTTEGRGVTFRISKYRTPLIHQLVTFLNGNEYRDAMMNKFGKSGNTRILTEVQKNLTKYEISPHPDIRHKAMTYLLNINRDDGISDYGIHTHLLKFKEEKQHIYKFWDDNPELERCWVPWEWCDSEKTISDNNTLVLFPPNNHTLHAVKLEYPHLEFQRTQIYGNLWYTDTTRAEPGCPHSKLPLS